MESEHFLSKANTKFALALFKEFSERDKTGNIFYSSFSISAALAMLRLGVDGSTKQQISKVLHFELPEPTPAQGEGSDTCDQQYQMQTTSQMIKKNEEDQVDVSFGKLLRDLNKPNNTLYDLSVANRLFAEQTFEIFLKFLIQTEKYYDAKLEKVDFLKAAEGARIYINDWVKEQTKDKITNLLPPNSVDSMTKMVLVNAIYFKGKWKSPFDKTVTHDAEFHLTKTDKKTVKMMKQTSSFGFRSVEEVNCKVLDMAYVGMDLCMVIMLPNDIEDDTTGLEKLESALTSDKFEEWTRRDAMELVKVEVSLPKFKMDKSYDMKEVLIALGMTEVFSANDSDFSGMSKSKDLSVSAVVHKSYVGVDEEGTEAAAATGIIIGVTSINLRHETFNANHPFLFFIKHVPSNSILFSGRFCSPE